MRSYDKGYDHDSPPASECPLFPDRETGGDRDAGAYREHVELHRCKPPQSAPTLPREY